MISVEALEKKLKANELDSMYLLYGEELFLMEASLKKIKNIFGELVKGINYIEISEDNIEELITDIETPAFGFEKKLIIVRNTNIFKREVKKKSTKVAIAKDSINDYIKDNTEYIKQNVVIVFVEEEVDKGKMLTTLEDAQAIICNFEHQKPAQIIARLKAICNAYKVNIEEKDLRYFTECIGTNMQDLVNEIRKQIEYVGANGVITKETIDLLSIKQMDSVIFDLTDSLGKKDITGAIQVLNNLIYAKEPLQKILITLYNHFKKVYIVKLSIKYNRNIAQDLNLKPNQMFLTTKYKKQSEYFKEEELKKILEELINLDKNYKIGLIDLKLGLEAILCRYCS